MIRIGCIVLALGLLLATQTVSADSVATVKVVPVSQEATVGEVVSVDIVVENVEGLSAWSLTLDYDDTILQFQNWEYGLWGSNGGVLATVTFLAIGTGTSELALSDVHLYDVTGAEIANETQDGSVTVCEEPTPVPTETPTLTPTETPVPTETFTPTAVPTATPTETLEPTCTPTETPSPTPIPTSTYTPEPTATSTFTPTATLTPTATATFTPTPTYTYTPTPTATSTPTHTCTPTPTSTWTPTIPPTATRTSSDGERHRERTETPAPPPTSSRTPVPTVSQVLPIETVSPVIVPPPTGSGGMLTNP